MSQPNITALDRRLAQVCSLCPVCRRARKAQHGVAFKLVKTVENRVCPFCRAYAKVTGRQPHAAEPVSGTIG
jgi:hypothetical protein